MGYRGVIFDVDGTLVDSNDAHARAWVAALEEAGRPVPYETIRPLIGMGGDKLLPKAAGIEAESAEGRAIAERRGAILREAWLPRIQAFPGSRELLEALHARGFRLAVASSAQPQELDPLLEIAGVRGLLHSKASSGDANHSKPDPDILHAALDRLECEPSEAMMVGDTPYDVEAATRAGVPCIAVRCGGWGDASFAGALAVHDGPWDLLRRLDQSVLARSAA
jgi:HAD superfamily hydrolase (TIGR01509 family)